MDRVTAEWKYRINGQTVDAGEVEVVDADCAPGNAPAKLTVSKDTFKGLIIADEVELSGNVEIIGAIISLTTISTRATAAGNPTIKYSCEAIEKYAGGKVKRKLSWNVIR